MGMCDTQTNRPYLVVHIPRTGINRLNCGHVVAILDGIDQKEIQKLNKRNCYKFFLYYEQIKEKNAHEPVTKGSA